MENKQEEKYSKIILTESEKLLNQGLKFEKIIDNMFKYIKINPESCIGYAILGTAAASRAGTLATAFSEQKAYLNLYASYEKQYQKWQQAQEHPDTLLYKSPEPIVPQKPRTTDDGQEQKLTINEYSEKISYFSNLSKDMFEKVRLIVNSNQTDNKSKILLFNSWSWMILWQKVRPLSLDIWCSKLTVDEVIARFISYHDACNDNEKITANTLIGDIYLLMGCGTKSITTFSAQKVTRDPRLLDISKQYYFDTIDKYKKRINKDIADRIVYCSYNRLTNDSQQIKESNRVSDFSAREKSLLKFLMINDSKNMLYYLLDLKLKSDVEFLDSLNHAPTFSFINTNFIFNIPKYSYIISPAYVTDTFFIDMIKKHDKVSNITKEDQDYNFIESLIQYIYITGIKTVNSESSRISGFFFKIFVDAIREEIEKLKKKNINSQVIEKFLSRCDSLVEVFNQKK